MAPNDTASLDSIVQQITTTDNHANLLQILKTALPKEARDVILASSLSSGQDPLSVLDLHANTLGVLYILSARLKQGGNPPQLQQIVDFTRVFSPEQARLAPERVTMLAKGIQRLGATLNNPTWTIEPLYNLTTRFPPDPSYLTPIHPIFLLQCAGTRHFMAASTLLISHPISEISISLTPDLTYNDNLVYHYLGGVCLAAIKKWTEAEEFFEICVSSPGNAVAALQLEALKKLRLVQLISRGQIGGLPKYTNPLLLRLLKNTPYSAFISAYPQKVDQLNSILEKEQQIFATEKNLGLIRQAIARAPQWILKKLTATYVTLGMAEIGKAVKIDNVEEVRRLILDMIENQIISAQISADDTITFFDSTPQFSKEEIDKTLREAQEKTRSLAELEEYIARSKDYLTKAIRKDVDWAGGMNVDEDMGFYNPMAGPGGGTWAEEFS